MGAAYNGKGSSFVLAETKIIFRKEHLQGNVVDGAGSDMWGNLGGAQ